jgi:hypothetical protein
MDTNHGGGTLLLNHKKKETFRSVAKKRSVHGRGRERERVREKLKIVYFLVMINYRILYNL